MLSLKKAGSGYTEPRSLPTINLRPVSFAGDEGTHSASPMHGQSHGISGASPMPDEEDVEVGSMSQWPRNRGPATATAIVYTQRLGAETLP